jgi:hypothetical protein
MVVYIKDIPPTSYNQTSASHYPFFQPLTSPALHDYYSTSPAHFFIMTILTNLILLPLALLTTTTAAAAETPKSRTLHPELNAALRTAATAFDRAALLPNDADWTYDFTKHPNYDSPTGAVINADAATFPAVTGLGSSVALLKLAPCGMLPPHLHPRATNIVTAITGNTTTYMIGENGVGLRKVELLPMMVTVFPQASLHMMQNNGMLVSPSFFHSSFSFSLLEDVHQNMIIPAVVICFFFRGGFIFTQLAADLSIPSSFSLPPFLPFSLSLSLSRKGRKMELITMCCYTLLLPP